MPSLLSTYDRFKDRLEIVGYGTTGLTGLILLIYFAMLFFSQTVQQQTVYIKLTILIISLTLFISGFFIPLYKNNARLFLRWLFLLLSSFSFFEFFDKGTWYFGLVFGYTLYGFWVLSHPVTIEFFRPLNQRELKLKKNSSWYIFHLTVLGLLTLIFFLKGWSDFLQEQQEQINQGLGYLGLSFLFMINIWGLRRLYPWARWLMVLISGVSFFILIPTALTNHVQNYPEYWKALFFNTYFLSLCIFLCFAPSVKKLYKPDLIQKKPA